MIGQQDGINGETIPAPVLHHPDPAVEKSIGGKGRHIVKKLKIEDCKLKIEGILSVYYLSE